MKVKDCCNFNPQFPELYPWGSVDSILAANISNDIINHIHHDLHNSKTVERINVPGLRLALNILASHTEA